MADLGHYEHSRRMENLGIFGQVQRPLKIVFLGAGSGFLQNLFSDILNVPGTDRGELALVDTNPERLDLAARLSAKIVEHMGKDWTVKATTDRKEVLAGADYIINCIEVSGEKAVGYDYSIPARYGVDQCIGDTIGPGGLFKALRTVPVFLEILADDERYCPQTWVLNYTNPMSIMCLAASRVSRARVVGLCHSVQATSHDLANYAGVPYEQMKWRCGGINHLSWFTELTHQDKDLYPVLLERLESDPELLAKDPVRFDMMKHFGHFITESSGHLSEYLPYYRKRQSLIDKHCGAGFLGESAFYSNNWPTWRQNSDRRRAAIIAGEEELTSDRTWEYTSYIIEAMETNAPFVIHGNFPNHGLIENLPADGIVEVASLVNSAGIHPVRFGRLPLQCAAICDWNMRMYDLAAQACIERSRELAAMALMLDPLTAAVCSPAEIKSMCQELFAAEQDMLPGF